MTKWEYRKLEVFTLSGGLMVGDRPIIGRDERGWYWDTYKEWRERLSKSIKSGLYAGGQTPTRLPLNPTRKWNGFGLGETLIWDEEAGYADLEIEVMNKLGAEGWELAHVKPGEYVFKRPIE